MNYIDNIDEYLVALQKRQADVHSTSSACSKDAVSQTRRFANYTDIWMNGVRGDWLMWLAGASVSTEDERRTLVRCAVDCVNVSCETAPNEIRAHVDAIIAWLGNKLSTDELRQLTYKMPKHRYISIYATAMLALVDYAQLPTYAELVVRGDMERSHEYRMSVRHRCANIVRQHYPTPVGLTTNEPPR